MSSWPTQPTRVIAVDGDYGTISEAAIALKLGKPVVALKAAWDLRGLQRADTARQAVDLVWAALGKGLKKISVPRERARVPQAALAQILSQTH